MYKKKQNKQMTSLLLTWHNNVCLKPEYNLQKSKVTNSARLLYNDLVLFPPNAKPVLYPYNSC